MIEGFRDRWLAEFFRTGKVDKRVPANIAERVFRKLQMIDDATCDADLRSPPSNHFEKLAGTLAGLHSIRVNARWRLVFGWDGTSGRAYDIRLDPHTYRS